MKPDHEAIRKRLEPYKQSMAKANNASDVLMCQPALQQIITTCENALDEIERLEGELEQDAHANKAYADAAIELADKRAKEAQAKSQELEIKLADCEKERDEANGYLDRWCHHQYTPDKDIFQDTVMYLAQFEEGE